MYLCNKKRESHSKRGYKRGCERVSDKERGCDKGRDGV